MLPKIRKAAESAIGDNPGGPSTPCPPFSQSQLLKVLVNFIVADDQERLCHINILPLIILHFSQ